MQENNECNSLLNIDLYVLQKAFYDNIGFCKMSEKVTGLKFTFETSSNCDEFVNAEVNYDVTTGYLAFF